MKKFSPTVQTSVCDLVRSGLGGLLTTNDTLGLWTFHDELHAGKVPMIFWTPETAESIAGRIGDFLKKERFQNKPDIDVLLPSLYSVMRTSKLITVVLVTTGTEPIYGTPYDREINQFFRTNQRAYEKKKMPFLTILVAQRGQFVGYSVGPALGDVKIPKPTAAPPPPAVAEAPPPAPPAAPAPRPTQALVITKSGAKLVGVDEARALADAASEEKFVRSAETNTAAQSEVERFAAAFAAVAAAQANSEPGPSTTAPDRPEPAPTATAPVESEPASLAPVQGSTTQPETLPTATPAPVIATEIEPPTGTPPAATPVRESTPAAPPAITPVAPDAPSASHVPEGFAEMPAPRSPAPVTTPAATPGLDDASPMARTAASGTAATQPATPRVAVVPVPVGSNALLYIVSGVLVAFAVIGAFLLGRQSGKNSGPSSITRSMERQSRT